MGLLDDVDAERAWAATVGALVVGLVGGSLLFPRRVYVEFVWHYFWGPVYADANGAQCVAWADGAREILFSAQACANAAEPVAYIGYSRVSEVGYMLVLVLALGGVVLLLDRLDVGEGKGFFYALLPYMFLGGALRVVEDAADAVPEGAEPLVTYPWNVLLISPIIYLTMFVISLAALVGSVHLARRGTVERYEYPLGGAGVALLALTVGYLVVLAFTREYASFHPHITLLTVGVATAAAAAVWWLTERFAPAINDGTGLLGAVVVWGHAIDGAANVIVLDWANELGLPQDYVPKHPVNRAIVSITDATLPEAVTAVTGTAWPFLVVKLVAATGAVWLFNEEIIEDSPRYSFLLLVAILAVGLGPGTRDMLRATFGI